MRSTGQGLSWRRRWHPWWQNKLFMNLSYEDGYGIWIFKTGRRIFRIYEGYLGYTRLAAGSLITDEYVLNFEERGASQVLAFRIDVGPQLFDR